MAECSEVDKPTTEGTEGWSRKKDEGVQWLSTLSSGYTRGTFYSLEFMDWILGNCNQREVAKTVIRIVHEMQDKYVYI